MVHQDTDSTLALGNYGDFNKSVKYMLGIIVKIIQENNCQNSIIKTLFVVGL